MEKIIVGRVLYLWSLKHIYELWKGLRWDNRLRIKKKKHTKSLEDGKETFVCETKEAKKKRKQAGIADFSFLSLLKENNAWLSSKSQALCRKSSHMRGTVTPSSLRSHSFLHAFLFWGVLMNDLKSDLFPSLGCLEGRWLAGGGVWRGEVDPDVKVSRLSREHKRLLRCSFCYTSNTDRMHFIYEIKCNTICFHEAGSVLTKGEGHVMHSMVVVQTGE